MVALLLLPPSTLRKEWVLTLSVCCTSLIQVTVNFCYSMQTFDSSDNTPILQSTGNNRVRKIATNGIVTTLVGNGGNNGAVDGVAATSTSVYYPRTALADKLSGDVYISDTVFLVRLYSQATGFLSTVVGSIGKNICII